MKSRPGGANRTFFNALLWMARTDAPWRDLPERLGKMERGVPAVRLLVRQRPLRTPFQGCAAARSRSHDGGLDLLTSLSKPRQEPERKAARPSA
ncbi:transposase [Polaromonas naphthalenivorans]|uniref:transposase n=1 Tax=Polaromonas naphthalenivorans TaxID=216465 RepID=UPI0038CD8C03